MSSKYSYLFYICTKTHILRQVRYFVVLLLCTVLNAEASNNIDSLIARLPELKGRELIKAYNTLAWELKYGNNELAWEYVHKASALLRNTSFKEEWQAFYTNMGALNILQARYDSSLMYVDKALELAETLKDDYWAGKLLNLQAIIYRETSNFKKAISSQKRALAIFEHLSDTFEILGNLNNLAITYGRMRNDSAELSIHLKVFDLEMKRGNDYAIARSANNVGMAYLWLKRFGDSRKYFEIGIERSIAANNLQFLASAYAGMGSADNLDEQYEKALSWFHKAIQICEKNHFNEFLANNLHSAATIYEKLGDNRNALVYYTKAVELLNDKGGNETNVVVHDISRAWLYLRTGEIDKTSSIATKYLALADSLDFGENYPKLLNLMANVEYQLGEYKEAYYYLLASHQASDSIGANLLKAQTEEIKTRYEVAQMEEANARLKIDLATQNRINRIQWTVVTVVSLLVIVSIVLLLMLRKKRKVLKSANLKLAEQKLQLEAKAIELDNLNHTKDMFFSIVAHDLKSPLQGILGCVTVLNEDYDSLNDSERQKMLSLLNGSTCQLAWLLDNLLQWARNQMKMHVVNPIIFSVKQVVDEELSGMMLHASAKNISLVSEVADTFMVNADQEMIRFVIRNLISNAVKFTPSAGSVRVGVSESEHWSMIHVIDNGIGMSEEQMANLFNIKTKGTTLGTGNEKGTGLGLVLCKDFIEQNHGRVEVESKVGSGTTFTVILPK